VKGVGTRFAHFAESRVRLVYCKTGVWFNGSGGGSARISTKTVVHTTPILTSPMNSDAYTTSATTVVHGFTNSLPHHRRHRTSKCVYKISRINLRSASGLFKMVDDMTGHACCVLHCVHA
jgi:hypothetical protein